MVIHSKYIFYSKKEMQLLYHLGTQLPRVGSFEQSEPNIRHVLKLGLHNGLHLIVNHNLAVFPGLDEQFSRGGDVREVVEGEEALEADAVLDDFLVC